MVGLLYWGVPSDDPVVVSIIPIVLNHMIPYILSSNNIQYVYTTTNRERVVSRGGFLKVVILQCVGLCREHVIEMMRMCSHCLM